ncbi:MAG: DNA polymerase III subunit delta [Muribaculaceae bacterium]|nr:DNA polymerase III subunit delta [Muribaculaceae bacterium]
MAKKTATGSFREIITEIDNGKFHPVYLLMGEEDYYIDKLVEKLENSVISEEEKDFNSMIFYGADTEIKDVISRAQQYPLMAERQLVILKEAQAMEKAKSQLEKLVPYLNHANEKTVLVIVYKGESLGATTGFVKAASEAGTVFKSERLRDYQLSGPVSDYCRSISLKIDDRSISLLCEYIGSPLSKLFGEIDKLKLAAGKDRIITPDLIESIIGISKEYNTFELIKAISVRDYASSMKIVNYFSKNPRQTPGVIIVASLFNYFSKLFIAAISRDKSDAALLSELDLKSSFALTDYKNGVRNYKAGTIDSILHALRDHDAKSKGIGSTQNEFELMKELIYKIFTLR